MGGNTKRKARRARERREAEWDLIATKALLTTTNPSSLYQFEAGDKALTLMGIAPNSKTRGALCDALNRAGIKASLFCPNIYQQAAVRIWGSITPAKSEYSDAE